MRDPAKWQPDFAPWLSLSADFVPLQKSLDKNFVKLKHGPDVGIMSPDVYDGMNSPALLMAKMALLNLFAVLRTQQDPLSSQPWFNSVRKILVVDQERFVAIVDPGLHDSVDNILKNMSSFGKQGFFPGEVTLHTDNIPSDYQLTEEMISVKRTYEEGNLQLTLGKARNNGVDCVLLDCDMDEHSNLFLHTGDLFKHTFTGGTNPIDIHEYIVNLQQGVDLGYALAPRGTGAEPMLLAKAKAAPRPRAAKRAAATA